ncbi:MAG: hypothetical protein FJ296_08475 [Planctomycetes bacterium]|nr:hypothetical protein [Planctomycetota bacterium]
MRRRALSFVLVPALVLALPGFMAPQAFDFGASTWSFTEAKAKFAGKAKGIGKLKDTQFGDGTLTLNGDNTWGLVYDGDQIASGSWAVEDEFDRSIDLFLADDGLIDLPTYMQDTAEAAAALFGIDITIDLDTLVLEKVVLKVKPNTKAGTVKAKISATYKYTGTTDGLGQVDAETTLRGKLTGTSDEQPLANVLPR